MPRRGHKCHRCVAERDLLPVGRRDIALGLAVREAIDRLLYVLPVRPTHDDAGPEAVLHQLGAADMVAMRMTDDDEFDPRGIEAELLHALDDRLLRIVVEDRVDQDDPFA